MWRRQSEAADWFPAFADALEAFAADLPDDVRREWVRRGDEVWLIVPAPTPAHRELAVSADPGGIEYSLGKIWTEPFEADWTKARRVLAACDAVRDGRVREVCDRRTGLLYHIYRLRSRGFREFMQDSEYSLWHWLRLKVNRVAIHRLPPLAA
jgi:hypothetical protein